MTNLRQRQPRIEDKAFLAYVRTQRCVVCHSPAPSQAAHIRMSSQEHDKRPTGAGEKPSDCWSVPLCAHCHLDGPLAQHKVGEWAFWKRVDIDPFTVAKRLYEEYQREKWPDRKAFT